MKKRLKTFCFFAMALLFAGSAAAAKPQAPKTVDHKADHDALRVILAKGAEALTTRNFDTIAPSLHPDFTIITVDNQKFSSVDTFKKHYASLFEGPDAKLDKVDIKLVADAETRFIDDNTGVVYGTSKDTYHFKDGDVRTMQTRWSAVTEKEGGAWKLVNVHFSTNLLDNPVTQASKDAAKKFSIGAGIAGLVLGVLLMMLLRRRPAA